MVLIGMKLSKFDLLLIILFIGIVSISIYNDKIKGSTKTGIKTSNSTTNNTYKLVDKKYYYELYQNINKIDSYKYVVYDKEKNIIDTKETDGYTYITIKDNIVEIRVNYGKVLSIFYDINTGTKLLEKQDVYFYNKKYIIVVNRDNIEIQNIENKDKYYKKKDIDKDILKNIINIKIKDENAIIKYYDGYKEKEYVLKGIIN